MSEVYGTVTRLGVYMRQVGAALQQFVPMDEHGALKAITVPGPSVDLGYAAATLIRLEERGIAKRYGQTNTFVRGELWNIAAKYYGWRRSADV